MDNEIESLSGDLVVNYTGNGHGKISADEIEPYVQQEWVVITDPVPILPHTDPAMFPNNTFEFTEILRRKIVSK